MSPVTLLLPPYNDTEPWLGDSPPLGSIALCRADLAGNVRRYAELLRQAPWCLPCVVTTPATSDPEIMTGIYELVGQVAFVPDPLRDELVAPLALAAARARPVPRGRQMAEYVAQRVGHIELRLELAAVLDPDDSTTADGGLPERTLRDRLRRLGPLTVRCWRTIGTLCRLAARMQNVPVETLAHQSGVEARTLRAWTESYLDAKLRTFRSRIGWEWVLEAALRRAGIVAVEAPARPPIAVADTRWSRVELPRTRPRLRQRSRIRLES